MDVLLLEKPAPVWGCLLPLQARIGNKTVFSALTRFLPYAQACFALRMTSTSHTIKRTGTAGIPIQLLKTDEAAAALGIGRRTLQERVAARELACVKIGKSIRFHPDDISAFIERNRHKALGWKERCAQ